jgi:hypothetical protein
MVVYQVKEHIIWELHTSHSSFWEQGTETTTVFFSVLTLSWTQYLKSHKNLSEYAL